MRRDLPTFILVTRSNWYPPTQASMSLFIYSILLEDTRLKPGSSYCMANIQLLKLHSTTEFLSPIVTIVIH